MADNRNFDGELTKAISGSLVAGRIVVMAVAIAIASVAVHGFAALALIKVGWLFWLNYLIAGIGWVIGAYFVLAGMTTVCKMAVGRESGQSWNIVSGIVDIFAARDLAVTVGGDRALYQFRPSTDHRSLEPAAGPWRQVIRPLGLVLCGGQPIGYQTPAATPDICLAPPRWRRSLTSTRWPSPAAARWKCCCRSAPSTWPRRSRRSSSACSAMGKPGCGSVTPAA